jgi:membrane-associated phospholipid phosphatase
LSASRAVFVPAVMGAGLLFWAIVIAREGFERSVAGLRRHRRVRARAQAAADVVVHPTADAAAGWSGLPRRSALAWGAAVCLGVAAYLLPGAVANYLRPGGYVAEIAWILALAVLAVTVFAVVGATLAVAALREDGPPPWVRPLLLALPLLRADDTVRDPVAAVGLDQHPRAGSWRRTGVSLAFLISAVLAATITLAVAMEDIRVVDLDARLLDRAREVDPNPLLSVADQLGTTGMAVLSGLVFMVAFRHRAPRLAVTYPIAVVLGVLANVLLSPVMGRSRPPEPAVGTALASYPSGHTIQAVLLAVFVTAGVHVWFRRRWLTAAAALAMGTAAALTGVSRVVLAAHWPTDVLGSVAIAAAVASVAVLATGVGLDRRVGRRDEPMLVLPDRLVAIARPAARASSLVVLAGFVLLVSTVGLPADPEGAARATEWERVAQSILFVAAGVATMVAWRWEAVGATALAVIATVLAVFAAVEYQPAAALLVTGAFFVPSALFWLSWQQKRSMRSLVSVALVAGVLVSGTWMGATTVHNHYFGPAHPESATVLPRSPLLEWVWAGGLSPTGFTVTAKLQSVGPTELLVAERADLGGAQRFSPQPEGEDGRVARFEPEGLEPDTVYHYAVARDGSPDRTRQGRVRTAPTGAASFTVTFGACARTGSSGAVFDEIAGVEPLLHLITGDFHYANVERDDPGLLRAALDRTIAAPAQQALYLQSPVAYVWDDHDYGGNDSDRSSPIRESAQAVYRSYVPHGPLAGDEGIQQAFSIGRVRFILTDTRSYRAPRADGSGTMLGREQLAWFEEELLEASRSHALVVWVSPSPWIGPDEPGNDTWAGFPDERRRLAELIERSGIENLVMLAGDAHMVGLDDGTNSGYGRDGGGGFPVAHGAALDRPGGVKGGPYSHGAFPGAGQFGVLRVDDDGTEVRVELSGRTWTGDVLFQYTQEIPSAPPRPPVVTSN